MLHLPLKKEYLLICKKYIVLYLGLYSFFIDLYNIVLTKVSAETCESSSNLASVVLP